MHSVSCFPILRIGFNDSVGFCGIREISFPRISCISFSGSRYRSMPLYMQVPSTFA